MEKQNKKTPKDVTEFEREQLRFFLSREDLVATLVQLNPSLAWLPAFAEMSLLQEGTQLAPWIEKNFSDPDAVKDVAANIRFFDTDTADVLEYRLNEQEKQLPEYLTKSWRLIIRQMRSLRRSQLTNEWFELAPRIKRGESSPEVLQRLADLLRPKLEVDKRLSWRDGEEAPPPKRPSDLMSIDFEVEDGVNEEEVLSVWPADATAQTEAKLLHLLTQSLWAALEEAIDAGVESDVGYGISDSDVPSIAKHDQNSYRHGFQPIVRVIAEIWTNLAQRDADKSIALFEQWRASPYRLGRRLALFAAANPIVSASQAADTLLAVPLGEFFLTSASVEVFRLLKARWAKMPPEKKKALEEKIIEGPPSNWWKEGAEIDRHIDRSRFEVLGEMQRCNLQLSDASTKVLGEIRSRWPEWQLRPAEQAGFHVWQGGARYVEGKADKLENVADEDLVDAAKRAADAADFMDGDAWQAFCQNHPLRALNGLEADAKRGQWKGWAWNTFLWAAKSLKDAPSLSRIAELLFQYPNEDFSEIAPAASWWLNESAEALDEKLLWPIWDRIEKTTYLAVDEAEVDDA